MGKAGLLCLLVLLAASCTAAEPIARSKLAIIVTGGSVQASASARASGDATASSMASGSAGGGNLVLAAISNATNGQVATAVATGVAEDGNTAEAIAIAIGSAQGEVRAEAVANAAADGRGNALAIAVAKAVQDGKQPEAVGAIVDAYALAENRGIGTAYAQALAVGVVSGGQSAVAYAQAISILLQNNNCENLRPTLLEAQAQAIADGQERAFADAFEAHVQVVDCIYPGCGDRQKECCSLEDNKCQCGENGCAYTLWKGTPKKMWACSQNCGDGANICICH